LFATTVNTYELLKTLKLIKTATNQDLEKLNVSHEAFFWALKHRMQEKQPKCANPLEEAKNHKSELTNRIASAPHVFALNLQWNGDPDPMEILKMLIALPGKFNLKDLFETDIDKIYTLKGFVGFQAAHYLAFFRRIPIKLGSFINPHD
jgi:hypothetical protein